MSHLFSRLRLGLLPLISILLLSGCSSDPFRSQAPTAAATDSSPVRSEAPEHSTGADAIPETHSERDTPPTDLWERIRRGQRLEIPDHPRVHRQLEWLAANSRHLEHTAQRAEPYLYFIVEEAERRGVPLELVLIPAVESGFQPRVRSPLQAAGLWQFMPSTAKGLGLKRSWWYEGRCDITSSTGAALDYLQNLVEQFDGDWELALAAYNAGPGTVQRAIRRNRERGLPLDYWSLELPRETTRYVPRLLAVAQAVRTPDAYGIVLPAIPNQAQFTRVDLPGQIDLTVAARLGEIELEELRRLNPGFHRWATDPDGPHALLLPVESADTFSARLAQLPQQQRITLHHYRIKRGDTLGGIAQRHGVSVEQLKKANNLRSTRVRVGRTLVIPVGPGGGMLAESAPAAATTRRTGPSAKHRVQPGDTLWGIARAHKVSHRHLADWNGLSVNDTLQPGQLLRLSAGSNDRANRSFSYRVRRGDSLDLIAQRFDVSVKELRRWNRLSGPHLQPGQQLTLYLRKPVTTAL